MNRNILLEMQRSKLADDIFGVPEQRKYPLDTKEHVYSAVKLFNHVDPKYEKELAENIIKKMNEYNITDIKPGPNNRFSKYYKPIVENSTIESLKQSIYYSGVLEAPTEVTPEDGDDTPADYSNDAISDTDEEPNDYSSDVEDDSDTDTTDDSTEDDASEDDTADDTSTDDTEEEPNDYSDDVEDDSTDTTDDSTEDDTSDDSTTDENSDDSNKIENNNIKNYNLLLDFQKIHKSIEDILQHLKTVNYQKSIQNSILSRCFDNLTKVEEELVAYIEFNFSNDYKKNLYYFNIYVQALRMNLELLGKIGELDEDANK